MLKVNFYDTVDDSLLKFAVIIARFEEKWVFCKHKERTTYELPGGHREVGETIWETAKRELSEETGAADFEISPVCVYSVTGKNRVNETGEETFGMLFCAEIHAFDKQLNSEMERVELFDQLPEFWTYPQIQPNLIEEYQKRVKPKVVRTSGEIVILPLEGMDFHGSPIRFGESRAQVESVLGAGENTLGNRVYYAGGELALDFDGDGGLEFIEFLGGADSALRPELYGQDVFESDADELLGLLLERNGADVDDSEAGYSYALRTLSIGLYREITPDDVNAMLKEMCNMDLTQMGGLDIEDEQKKARHWATVGIGREHYYG